jgi:hypothetical protein
MYNAFLGFFLSDWKGKENKFEAKHSEDLHCVKPYETTRSESVGLQS